MPRFGYVAIIAALSLCTFAACSVFRGDDGKGQIIFSHTMHAEQAGCGDCHDGVAESEGSGGKAGAFIPAGHAGCESCHDVEDKEGCATCHRGAREGVKLARVDRQLNFSHKAHGERVKECKTCHAPETRGGANIPGHATCNTAQCHAKQYKTLQCDGCHRSLERYRLGPKDSLTHGPGFNKSHGILARQNVRACTQCHDQTYCADCHTPSQLAKASVRFPEAVTSGFIHRGDFISRHGIEARSDPQSCRKCHGQRQCRSCHALNGLATAPHADLEGGRTRSGVHPAGWMVPGSGDFHGHEARLDINRCASCHDKGTGSNCVKCHRVGGMGGSPHPPGWSWRDKQNQCRNTRMCRTCHINGSGCQ